MKLHFEPDLDFQQQAIESVCRIFRGQEINRSEFTVTSAAVGGQLGLGYDDDSLGYGNRLGLLEDQLLENVKLVQTENGLPPSESLTSGDFTVEMETGTGKTYVYLRTIFELNKRYGFTKFVIVVPSVAIREGVYKTLQMTEEHLKSLYSGQPYEYFVYDSSKLGQVRNFATSAKIQIMVVTVGAINKKGVNNLYKDSEKTGGERPIDLIKATNPILIIDEPQSVDGGPYGRGREALARMNPLCTLRYSATHVEKHHMVYRLDAVDAYERKLVKQIEVAGSSIENAHNAPYVRLISTKSEKGTVTALVEIDVATPGGKAKRVQRRVNDGDDLEQETRRELYRDVLVGEIHAGGWMELRVPGQSVILQEGQAYGDVDEDAIAREMIRRTIKEHLDKEKRLRPKGIKVLSLFFIPRVDLYRQYDEDGNQQPGPYAKMFEEEYRRVAAYPTYQELFEGVDLSRSSEEVHNGYFSIDRKRVKGQMVEMYKDTSGSTKADDDTYSLIMRDKERLLSLDEPLKFIFSHSALREGWDNPNVFQICTLRDMKSERQRRQTIGRGLRICVNQDGQRVRGHDINTLTVIATESYEEFAQGLQTEIEKETGFRFGVIETHQFASIPIEKEDGTTELLGMDASRQLWDYLVGKGYLTPKGQVTDLLRQALRDDEVELPDDAGEHREPILALMKKHAGRLDIKNAEDKRTIRARQAVLDSPEFKELWDRIKYKTTYRVEFDADRLIEECVHQLKKAPQVPRARLQWRKGSVSIGQAGVDASEVEGAQTVTLSPGDIELPDILTELQDRTQLTRRSIYRILTECKRLPEFKHNPQRFIEQAADVINRAKRHALVDGIKYQKVGDSEYYAQELFQERELLGYISRVLKDETEKSVYEEIVYESDIEKTFAHDLQMNTAVKVFAKLPEWFRIPTPLGSYNPDWAVVIEEDGSDRLYFVVETKGSLFDPDRRATENYKIACGKRHVEALATSEPEVKYMVATELEDVLEAV